MAAIYPSAQNNRIWNLLFAIANNTADLDVAGGGGTTLDVAAGGTGATSFTSNAILVGNGTGAIQSSLVTITSNAIAGANSVTSAALSDLTLFTGTSGGGITVKSADGGVVLASPTGGSKGAGTINATGFFINGVAVGTGSGNVSSNGTPVSGQVALWTNSSTIQGTTGATIVSGVLTLSSNAIVQGGNSTFGGGGAGSQAGIGLLYDGDAGTGFASTGTIAFLAQQVSAGRSNNTYGVGSLIQASSGTQTYVANFLADFTGGAGAITNHTGLLIGTRTIPTGNYGIYDASGYNSYLSGTTSASTSLLGALVVGNGTAATSVGIGAGKINAGGTITAAGSITITSNTENQIQITPSTNTNGGIIAVANSPGTLYYGLDGAANAFGYGAYSALLQAPGQLVLASGGSTTLTLSSGHNATFAGTVTADNAMTINGAAGGATTILNFKVNGTALGVIGSGGAVGGSATDMVLYGQGTANMLFYTNNGTLALTLSNAQNATFAGSITTAAPSGGTAGAWKHGILVTAASTVDLTKYIQLDVGGTLYKVATMS